MVNLGKVKRSFLSLLICNSVKVGCLFEAKFLSNSMVKLEFIK